jgi:histidinol-phosphate aminotransferase
MALSRRDFVRTLGLGGAGVVSGAFVSARGREDLVGLGRLESGWSVLDAPANGPVIRISSNENPNGPGPRALEAVRAALGDANRYPYEWAGKITKSIADRLGVAEENILTGCGSGEILRITTLAFTSAARALVTAAPSFEEPERTATNFGHALHAVPVTKDLALDLPAMLSKASGAGLVFFCNPNNPTGTVYGDSAVKDFIRAVNRTSPETIILVDEAYHEYVADPAYRTAIPVALENPTVIVARTFSKVYGLAGLRLGYAVGRPETLNKLRRYRLGNNVNALAAAAGVATLPDTDRVAREVTLNAEARDFTAKAFADMGYPSQPSHANFVIVNIRRDVKAFQEGCRAQNVLVGRTFPPLTTCARVSIGTMDEMRQAVGVFKKVLG